MSTRGFIGVVAGEQTVFAYNHSDSYPSWLGVRMVEQAREIAKDIDGYVAKVAALRLVDEHADFTPEDREKYGEHWQNVSSGTDWYSLLRSLQGDMVGYLDAGVMPSAGVATPQDLDHEWGYLIDLNDKTLKVSHWRGGDLATWPLDALPDEAEISALER